MTQLVEALGAHNSVADPDLQIMRERGGGHGDPEVRGGGGLIKKFIFGHSGLSSVKQ